MKKLLFVSPHFPPSNTPDMQRIRMALPYIIERGFEVTVLCVDEKDVEAPLDDDLLKTIPDEVNIVRVRAWSVQYLRFLGVRGVALRSIWKLFVKGSKLVQTGRYDLIYFSTTVFLVTIFGPYWKRKNNVPYIVDYQDPWINEYYHNSRVRPPGGWLKFSCVQLLARFLEPIVVRNSSHITVVSKEYEKQLCARYNGMKGSHFTTLPFGAPEKDFELLPKLNIKNHLKTYKKKVHLVYVGRIGSDMTHHIKRLFSDLAAYLNRSPEMKESVLLSFWGTSYAPKERAVSLIQPLIAQFGLTDSVVEHLERIPYFEALKILSSADGLILFGSQDASYNPSKLAPYLLANKPLLVAAQNKVLREQLAKNIISARFELYDSSGVDTFLDLFKYKKQQSDSKNILAKESTAKEMSDTLMSLFSTIL